MPQTKPLPYTASVLLAEASGGGGRREVKYQVCQMAPSTIKNNEAEKGFAIINRVKREAFTERWHLEWRP